MKTYITYGFNHFDKNIFGITENNTIENFLNKPQNAWWGSPVDTEFGWKEWCESRRCGILASGDKNIGYIKWKLNEGAKLLYIENYSDLLKIPFIEENIDGFSNIEIDFNKLRQLGYCGMEICMDKYYFGHMYSLPNSAINEVLKETKIKSKHKLKNIFETLSKLEMNLKAWDCDSICIWDANAIEILEEKSFEKNVSIER